MNCAAVRFVHSRFKRVKRSKKTARPNKVALLRFKKVCFSQLAADPVNRDIDAVGQSFMAAILAESAQFSKDAPLTKITPLTKATPYAKVALPAEAVPRAEATSFAEVAPFTEAVPRAEVAHLAKCATIAKAAHRAEVASPYEVTSLFKDAFFWECPNFGIISTGTD